MNKVGLTENFASIEVICNLFSFDENQKEKLTKNLLNLKEKGMLKV